MHWSILVCALTGNQILSLGVSGWRFNQLSYPGRAWAHSEAGTVLSTSEFPAPASQLAHSRYTINDHQMPRVQRLILRSPPLSFHTSASLFLRGCIWVFFGFLFPVPLEKLCIQKNTGHCPAWYGSVDWGQTANFRVRIPVRAHAWVAGQAPGWGCARGNQSMHLSHTDVSLPLSLPPFLSL